MAKRKRLVRGQREAEKWLATEMVMVAAIRTMRGFQAGGLPGPSAYVPILLAYGLLASLTLWDEAAEVAAILGLLLMFAVLFWTPKGQATTTGAQVFSKLGEISTRAAGKQAFAQEAKVKEA